MKEFTKPIPGPHTKTVPLLTVESVPREFTASQEQINALARRMIPEIKRLFADERIQREFARWQERQRQQHEMAA